MFTVCLVGRPNVGKSSLYNRLAKKNLAIVDETAGMTRDWREKDLFLDEDQTKPYKLCDTPGIKEFSDNPLAKAMEKQTRIAVEKSNLVLFVVDAVQGIVSVDKEIAVWLRRQNVPTVLVVNKSEKREALPHEAYTLGYSEVVQLSAREGLGLYDLQSTLADYIPQNEAPTIQVDSPYDLQIGIVGRPNVGKSTFVNTLLNEERLITSAVAGSTRDAIAVPFKWQDKVVNVVDTAGLRKRAKEKEKAEQLAVRDTLRTINYAQLVFLLTDANRAIEHQDLDIAQKIIKEGRLLIIVVNKIDTISTAQLSTLKKDIDYKLEHGLSSVKNPYVFYVSALNKLPVDALFKTAFAMFENWQKRPATHALNNWLAEALSQHQPPLISGKRLKVKYITQVKTRPPTFTLFANMPEKLPESYLRYLENSLRVTFNFKGIPLRLKLKKPNNPYVS